MAALPTPPGSGAHPERTDPGVLASGEPAVLTAGPPLAPGCPPRTGQPLFEGTSTPSQLAPGPSLQHDGGQREAKPGRGPAATCELARGRVTLTARQGLEPGAPPRCHPLMCTVGEGWRIPFKETGRISLILVPPDAGSWARAWTQSMVPAPEPGCTESSLRPAHQACHLPQAAPAPLAQPPLRRGATGGAGPDARARPRAGQPRER